MGNDIIISDANFFENSIFDGSLIPYTSGYFYARTTYNSYQVQQSNATRCCTGGFDLPAGTYTSVKMRVKDGFDFVLGVKNGSTCKYYKGNNVETSFDWETNTQEVVAPISSSSKLYINFRYDDNTTRFSLETKITDIIDYLKVE